MSGKDDTVRILKSTLKTMIDELTSFSKGEEVFIVDGENTIGMIMGHTMLSALNEWDSKSAMEGKNDK